MRRRREPTAILWCSGVLALLLGSRAVMGQVDVPGASSEAERDKAGGKVLLLVRGAGDEELLSELRVELRHTPFRILELRLDERFTHREPLGVLGREQLASAAVRIALEESRIELWVHHPEGDVLDSLQVPAESLDARIDALRIAEALRAHGLDLGPRPGRVEPEEPPPVMSRPAPPNPTPSKVVSASPSAKRAEPPRPVPDQRSGGFWIGVGGEMVVSSGGLPPAAVQTTSLGYGWRSRWMVVMTGEVPLMEQRVSGIEGTAEISNYALGLAVARTLYVSPRFVLSLGLGSAGHVVVVDGEAAPGYQSSSTTQTLLSSFATSTMSVPIAPQLRLSSRQFAGVTFSELQVQMGDTVRAKWGRVVAGASLGVDYLF
jgi:hypothetical protein